MTSSSGVASLLLAPTATAARGIRIATAAPAAAAAAAKAWPLDRFQLQAGFSTGSATGSPGPYRFVGTGGNGDPGKAGAKGANGLLPHRS